MCIGLKVEGAGEADSGMKNEKDFQNERKETVVSEKLNSMNPVEIAGELIFRAGVSDQLMTGEWSIDLGSATLEDLIQDGNDFDGLFFNSIESKNEEKFSIAIFIMHGTIFMSFKNFFNGDSEIKTLPMSEENINAFMNRSGNTIRL